MAELRVAVVQSEPLFGERERNAEQLRALCAGLRAELVVLPELCTTGYRFAAPQEVEELAEPASGGPSVALFEELARQTGATVVGGFAERGPGGRAYNAAAVCYPSGLVCVYRKLHLFGEEPRWFAPGEDLPPVVHTPCGLRVGVMICFDWLFPEVMRYLALEGADLVAHPANLVLPWCPDGMPIRCLENGVFAATADRVGAEARPAGAEPLRFIGRSQIVAPDGTRLAALGERQTGVALAAVDLDRARCGRLGAAGRPLELRRADRLELRARPGPGWPAVRPYALLSHQTPDGAVHYDLLLERGGLLRAWRLGEPPRPGLPAERSFDHRLAYLEYEGELGGGRGRVRRLERGRYRVLEESPRRLRFVLEPEAAGGAAGRPAPPPQRSALALVHEQGARWRLEAAG
ncbi:MAG: hypothetical protein KatS3mg102_1343 [Planctomycetota bacterium]|nr:MAG: hypothetical protein KatS3mg102_1343 [Planctomycetota bacterium]